MAAVPYRAGTMPDRPGTPQHRCCMPIAERNVAMRQVMLRAEGLAKGFTLHLQGGVRIPVLSDLGFEVHAGECVALVGPSGAGKTTLMRSLYGNYRAESGRILMRHCSEMVDIARADPRLILAVRRETLGYVSQFLRVVPRVPAVDVVAEAMVARGGTTDAAHRAATELLLRLNIPRRMHALPPATFSGGEQQRVNLARGFIAGHPILLLDEPTASLDADNKAVVIAMINETKKAGTAIVAIMHDTATRDAVADRLFQLTPLRDAA
jgi:alpha-D-ribose 1-methylphosphonate 5-triphosphate synthase subunit PhnL